MSDVTICPASVDDMRSVEMRLGRDETTVKLSQTLAERGFAWAARDQSETVGVACAHVSDEERFVGELFVEPSYRGQGIGARLLDAALEDDADRARYVLFDAADRASLALAARRGLAAGATIVRVAGAIPREDCLLAMAAGDYRFQVDTVDPIAHAFALSALDRETRNTTRLSDHEWFAREAIGLAFFSDGEFVAYVYVWPDGRIGPLAASSAAYVVQIFAYALVTMQRRFSGSWCTALIPGHNLRLLRAALRAGLRLESTLTLAGDAPMPDLSRYAGFHPLLF